MQDNPPPNPPFLFDLQLQNAHGEAPHVEFHFGDTLPLTRPRDEEKEEKEEGGQSSLLRKLEEHHQLLNQIITELGEMKQAMEEEKRATKKDALALFARSKQWCVSDLSGFALSFSSFWRIRKQENQIIHWGDDSFDSCVFKFPMDEVCFSSLFLSFSCLFSFFSFLSFFSRAIIECMTFLFCSLSPFFSFSSLALSKLSQSPEVFVCIFSPSFSSCQNPCMSLQPSPLL